MSGRVVFGPSLEPYLHFIGILVYKRAFFIECPGVIKHKIKVFLELLDCLVVWRVDAFLDDLHGNGFLDHGVVQRIIPFADQIHKKLTAWAVRAMERAE